MRIADAVGASQWGAVETALAVTAELARRSPRLTLLFCLPVLVFLGMVDRCRSEPESKSTMTTVRLAGPVSPRIRYAGYLVQREFGYDRDAGLQIELNRMSERAAIKAVREGKVEFGIATFSKLLAARSRDNSLVLVSAILQHAPTAILVDRSAAATLPEELAKREILLTPGTDRWDFDLMFASQQIAPEEVRYRDGRFDLGNLPRGPVGFAGDATVLPLLLRWRERPVSIVRPRKYALSLYGDCIFCRTDTARRRNLVTGFSTAIAQGWRRTFTHPGETIQFIHRLQRESKDGELPPTSTAANDEQRLELLRFELERLAPLVMPNLVELGHVSPPRVDRIARHLGQIGRLSQDVDLTGFVYQAEVQHGWLRWLAALAWTVVGLAGGLGLVVAWNVVLRRQVARRTARLEAEVHRRRDVELQLRRSNENLEHVVAERTRTLREANEDLDAYARSAAHDLRAPLRAMYGFAMALREDCTEQLNDEGREYVQYIESAARDMDQLLLDVLEYSRVGRERLTIGHVDLDDVVDQATKQLQVELSDCNAFVDIQRPLGSVKGHHNAAAQVVSNLISNAAKFVEPGVTPSIRVWTELRDQRLRLWVEDNGIGIAEEYQSHIFAAFERLHGAESYPGNGIGLAIVNRALRGLDGTSGVVSELGVGSRFWIELPRSVENASPAPAKSL